MSRQTRVGFVGLGNMGGPMATNIAHAGFNLVVRDMNENLASKIARSANAVAAKSPSDFAGVEVLVTMLPTSTVVSQALFEWGDGIVQHLPADAVIVDMSSSDPAQTRELGKTLQGHGIHFLDAPVSGGTAKAMTGELSIMLGGNNTVAIAKALPIVESMSSTIFRTGSLGSGHAMKALNNFVAAAATTAACEALIIGNRFGLDQHTILDVLNSSTGRSWVTENVLGAHVVDRKYASGFSLALYSKDVGIAEALATTVDDPAPVCKAVSKTMKNALSELGNVDHTEAITYWETERSSNEF